MSVRKRALNAGWYPKSLDEIKKTLDDWGKDLSRGGGIAAVVPHAGWYFSGKLAFQTFNALSRNLDLMVVLGGHLSADSPIHIAGEDEFEVPGGALKNDLHLVEKIKKTFQAMEDWDIDNGVEVQLPLIQYFWPDIKVVSIRVPPTILAIDLGEMLYKWSLSSGEKIAVIGSTDLTHYGPNYGYTPHGPGKEAVTWVESKNDAEIIQLLLSMKEEQAVLHARDHRSACSIGAAVTAMAYARLSGIKKGVLKGYLNSYRVQPGASFVGYAGVIYA